MEKILDFVSFGENFYDQDISSTKMLDLLRKLEVQQLQPNNYKWQDVSLLFIFNSKFFKAQPDQIESDQSIVSGLSQFCTENDWFPSFMGISAFSSFFSDGMERNSNITDGILLVAVICPVLDRLPVVYEISPNKESRKYAGVHVIEQGLKEYRTQMKASHGSEPDIPEIFDSCTGILFTTGIGHVEAKEFIDFTDSYAIGQEMMDTFESARITGGCSSNRSGNQLQCIYYSEYVNGKPNYRYTYKHGAVFTFLPYTPARFLLLHPYKNYSEDRLTLEFHPRDQYAPGRYHYVKTINGKEPVDFLSELWQLPTDELYKMQVDHTPIPAEPRTYSFTIGSSKSFYDNYIWPNVIGWLEMVDGKVLLRLVRAEASDSNYYLMSMAPNAIEQNAEELAKYFLNNFGRESTILSFVCESRKYYLNSVNSNVEAETILSSIPDSSKKIGIYVNGEYSVGFRKSIGYHNFSQISTIVPDRDMTELPFPILKSIQSKTQQTKANVKIFLSHSSRDKSVVHEIRKYMSEEVKEYLFWIDEQKLITGDTLKSVLERTIQEDTNYLIVFISNSSIRSHWVEEEVGLAIKKEIETGRSFILPVLLDDVWGEIASKWKTEDASYFTGKKYVRLHDQTEESLKMVARRLSNDIAEWIIRGQKS